MTLVMVLVAQPAGHLVFFVQGFFLCWVVVALGDFVFFVQGFFLCVVALGDFVFVQGFFLCVVVVASAAPIAPFDSELEDSVE
ncbi:hypothetical protein EDC96DRAFT_517980 [Choanephora cucurbitarum]|nr:hypothetical protein EDC96DRAFT_517980 [Choanephora cucurbitarum]